MRARIFLVLKRNIFGRHARVNFQVTVISKQVHDWKIEAAVKRKSEELEDKRYGKVARFLQQYYLTLFFICLKVS